jgi:hypothetical protein
MIQTEETTPGPRAIIENLTQSIYESNERLIESNNERRDAELARLAADERILEEIAACRVELQVLQSGFGNVAATLNELRQSTEVTERYVRVEASRTKQEMKEQEQRWLDLTMQLGQQVALLDKSNKAAAEANRMLVDQLQLMHKM